MNNKVFVEGKIISINPKYNASFTILDSVGVKCCFRYGYNPVLNSKVKGYCKIQKYNGKDQYVFIDDPQIVNTLEIDRKSIIKSIIKALEGTRFGQKSADKLYDDLLKQGEPFVILNKAIVSTDSRKLLNYHLKENQVEKLVKWWDANQSKIFLLAIGVSNQKINRLNHEQIKKLYEEPFKFYDLDIEKCKSLCDVMGIYYRPEDIIAGDIGRQLKRVQNEYLWTYLPFLKFSRCIIDKFDKVLSEYEIVELDDGYGFNNIIEKECFLGKFFIEKAKNKNQDSLGLDKWEPKNNRLSEIQRDAIKGSLTHCCSIITGGAGTGKTTIIGEIIRILESNHKKYVCVTFTGKAASRLRQSLRPNTIYYNNPLAFTFHSLISRRKSLDKQLGYNSNEYNGDNDVDEDYFISDDENTISYIPDFVLEPHYVIIDEASMVTGQLLYEFLATFPMIKNIILVGDSYQLEPFGEWGRPFLTLIKSNLIQCYELNINFRSTNISNPENDSMIVINANKIRENINNERITFIYNEYFKYCEGNIDNVLSIYKELINKGIRRDEIKILSPTRKYVQDINLQCQNIWSKMLPYSHIKIDRGNKVIENFYLHDRVIMTKNNYQVGIMNGEEGYITHIDSINNEIQVTFDSVTHTFTFPQKIASSDTSGGSKKNNSDSKNNLSTGLKINKQTDDNGKTKCDIYQLKLAYSLTVHKSQGSEYPYVILYFPTGKYNANLVYTAITRAKKQVFCVDNKNIIEESCSILPPTRYESFPKYLQFFNDKITLNKS